MLFRIFLEIEILFLVKCFLKSKKIRTKLEQFSTLNRNYIEKFFDKKKS